MKVQIISIFCILLIFNTGSSIIINGDAFELSQNEIIFVNTEKSNDTLEPSDGFTLFAPEFSLHSYLIDIEGSIVHSWSSKYIQALAVYLMENGNLIRSCFPGSIHRFKAGGITGRIEMYNWDGDLVWEFDYSNNDHCLHHDVEVLPNGNILMIAWEYKSLDESILAGRNPNQIPSGELWPDHIIEVEPIGTSGGNIIWEWHIWDHLIQEYDSSKNNYGIVAEHPELLDINFGVKHADWNHINSIDYNEALDQIILSSHNQNEIWMIDHSTSTEEAAGHTGGKYGKGGDILYRWGNPQTYDAGGPQDQILFGQHDAQWIELGHPGEGNIIVFNNGQGRPDGHYSSIDEITPPLNNNGTYTKNHGEAFKPDSLTWRYIADIPSDFFASHISGTQRLPNGNTLICHGEHGYFFEVTPDNEIVWEYYNDDPPMVSKNVFKIRRYDPNYPGLANLFDNHAPQTPSTPNGISSGETGTEYTFTSSTIDPDENDVFYQFNWGDGTTSEWIGPISSGQVIEITHAWDNKGDYEIRVKARDIFNAESSWSDPLSISMPKTYIHWKFQQIQVFIEQFLFNFI